MFIILLYTAICSSRAHGLPILPPDEATTCDTLGECRTLWGIILSCLSTIYLCAWVSLHVDVPNPRWPVVVRPFGRVLTFVVMTVLPETWVHLSIQQLFTARDWSRREPLRAACKPYWGMHHGWLVVMGGFALKTGYGEDDYDRLTAAQLEQLLGEQKIALPNVMSKEIEDRSKASGFAKFVVLLQTGWFVLNLIARRVSHLPIIPLEIFTLAFTLITFVLYLLAWDKPYEMGMPYFVELLSEKSSDAAEAPHDVARRLLKQRPHQFSELPVFLRRPLFEPLLNFMYGLSDYLGLFDPHFVYFHAQDTSWDRMTSGSILEIVTISFSAIHFLGWNLEFPSPICQYLWRASTVASTGIPLFGLVVVVAFYAFDKQPGRLRMFIDFINVFVYILCRGALLLLTVWTLTTMPPGAYQTVPWARFIPHI